MYMPGYMIKPATGAPPSFSNTKSIGVLNVANAERTQGTGDSLRKMTFNFWVRCVTSISDAAYISAAGSADYVAINGKVLYVLLNGGSDGSATATVIDTANTWYQITVQIDTANANAADRCLVWRDGAPISVFQSTVFTQNYNTNWGANGVTENVILPPTGGTNPILIDELSKIDNQLLGPSSFADGSHKPKDISGLTFGSQGYWLRFETGVASTVGNDSSGNGNNFTNNGYVNGDFSSTVP